MGVGCGEDLQRGYGEVDEYLRMEFCGEGKEGKGGHCGGLGCVRGVH